MSALPKAVQKQIEEANRLAEQLAQSKNQPASPSPGTPAPDPGAQPATTATDAGQSADTGQPATPAPSPTPVAEGWEQKYRVLQGKYNAEVPRLQRMVNEQATSLEQLKQQLTATQMMLASFGQNRGAAPGTQSSAPAAPTKLVKDEEVREYGEDLTDFIKRVAQDAVLPKVEQSLQPMKQQVEQVRSVASQVTQRAAATDQERLLATLDREVDGWRQQNEDEAFLAWLAQPDPYSGVTRQDLLRQAYERFDAPRVVAFFKGYRNEHAVVTPPPTAAAPQQDAPQRSLDTFVAPGTPKAGATGAQNGAGKRIWTEADIKQFYTEAAAGKYRNNKQRRDEIERDIHAAVREGRVR